MDKLRNDNSPNAIILDTNILQYITNENFGKQIEEYLLSLIASDHTLMISDITYAELLAGLKIEAETKPTMWLSNFPSYAVTTSVLIASARLHTIYSLNELNPEQFSLGDRIIASTAILNGTYILTSNGNDFPRPFFLDAESKEIIYTIANKKRKPEKRAMICLNLLKPNDPYIAELIDQYGYNGITEEDPTSQKSS